ncbi:hypothetical protein, partial [Pseudoduganella sp. RAF53_2]|uniref:hypothetical protein n=1 Tax=Pseudoduganella sp. RAF53_2 TaxID=3233060 RepID=UPI003F9CAB1D
MVPAIQFMLATHTLSSYQEHEGNSALEGFESPAHVLVCNDCEFYFLSETDNLRAVTAITRRLSASCTSLGCQQWTATHFTGNGGNSDKSVSTTNLTDLC